LQVDGSISRQYGGFGLGLSITQELVKAHGGELWVRSREGKGSSFSFTLPSFTGQSKAATAAVRVQATASITPGTVDSAAPGTLTRRGSRAALPDAGSQSRRGSVLLSPSDGSAGGADGSGRQRQPQQLDSASSMGLSGEFGDGLFGDEYSRELPYDAAQLSALASSKPFTAPAASSDGQQQRQQNSHIRRPSSSASSIAGSTSRRVGGAEGAAAGQPVLLDPRPTQFARTGRHQVLSVDDDILNQTVVQSLLSSTGYEVVCLPSGVATLEYIDSAEVLPDLILLDVMMPDMSG
jgi:CheY-like chemotaxis protein